MRCPLGLNQDKVQAFGYKHRPADGRHGSLAATKIRQKKLQNEDANRAASFCAASFYARSPFRDNYKALPLERFGKAPAVLESFQSWCASFMTT